MANDNPKPLGKLTGYDLGDFLNLDCPEPVPMLGDWLRPGARVMVAADSGVGKSLFAMGVALAVASGGRYLGWEVPEPRRVLYVDGEMTTHQTKRRLGKLITAMDGGCVETAKGNLRLTTRSETDLEVSQWIDLADGRHHGRLMDAVASHGADLVILDNLSECANVVDENSTAGIRPVIDAIHKVSHGGAAVILLHHTRKGARSGDDGYRGSSAIKAAMDLTVNLTKREGYGWFTVEFGKDREGVVAGHRGLEVGLEEREEGEGERWRWREEVGDGGGRDQAEEILEEWKTGKYATQAEMAEATGRSPSAITRAKKVLMERGVIRGAEHWRSLRASQPSNPEEEF